jgi:bifunctional non-homologous end joining protein LigD
MTKRTRPYSRKFRARGQIYRENGWPETTLTELVAILQIERMPLFTDKPPFENPPKVKEKVQWIGPKLVCKVAYAKMTADEQLRQTTFLGRRDDKDPKDVVLERP